MKERFAKLLLGEDMSGGGKGVCTALAISNAITNLSGLYKFLSCGLSIYTCFLIIALNINPSSS
jgi:hypothetical protein